MQWLIDLIKSLVDEVPAGTVCMWFGKTSEIPDGWVLCDGNNDTFDMRGLFPVGTGSPFTHGSTGGALTHYHTADQDPHSHTLVPGTDFGTGSGLSDDTNQADEAIAVSYSDHKPPFRALRFIMKL